MPLAISPKVRLYKEDFGVVIRLVNSDEYKVIPPLKAMILCLFNGKRSVEHVINITSQVLEVTHEEAEKIVKRNIEDFRLYLIEVNEEAASSVRSYDPRDFLFKVDEEKFKEASAGVLRLRIPLGFAYIVTHMCHLRCIYCYAGAEHPPKLEYERWISLDSLRKIFNEAAELGITLMLLSGGEPFLRPDLLEIIRCAISKDIYVVCSTKAFLEEEKVKKLKEAGLEMIQVSIDSPRPEVQDFLTGVKGSWERILNTIKLFVKYDIEVRINSVLTAYTIREVPQLVRLLAGLGVTEITLSPYGRSSGRHKDEFFPSFEDYRWLDTVVNDLQRQFKDITIRTPRIARNIDRLLRGFEPEEMPLCGACRLGFVILPDGKVNICERLAWDERFIVGDLTNQSILEVWNSTKLKQLMLPSIEHYIGTPCFHCEKYEFCTKKGRCYARILSIHQDIYQPEPLCKRAKEFLRFF